MRLLTAGLFSSADGVVEAPNLFQFDSFDEELGQFMMKSLAPITGAVLGRVSYTEWAAYWPTAKDGGFEEFINPLPKYVASKTLTAPLEWQNSTLIEGDLFDFVRNLKETGDGEIGVMGSLSVTRQLIKAGLLDRLSLIVHPVLAGHGRHLFDQGDEPLRLTLVDSIRTSAGNVVNTYERRES